METPSEIKGGFEGKIVLDFIFKGENKVMVFVFDPVERRKKPLYMLGESTNKKSWELPLRRIP